MHGILMILGLLGMGIGLGKWIRSRSTKIGRMCRMWGMWSKIGSRGNMAGIFGWRILSGTGRMMGRLGRMLGLLLLMGCTVNSLIGMTHTPMKYTVDNTQNTNHKPHKYY